MSMLTRFDNLYVIDFEFCQPSGEQFPEVRCLSVLELRTGKLTSCWGDELYKMKNPPFDISVDAVIITFYGSAELNCFLALGWAMPFNHIDT